MRCPHCDTELPNDAIFCSECGSRITATPAHFKVEETIITARPAQEPPAPSPYVDPDPAAPVLTEPAVPVLGEPIGSEQLEDDYPYEPEPPHRRRWPVVLGLTLLIGALLAGLAWVTYDAEMWGGHTLPNVVGQPEAEAAETLSAAGFPSTVTYELRDDQVGLVLSMSPAGDQRVDPGTEVRLRVGAARVVPEVIGLMQDEARQALLDVGAKDIVLVSAISSAPEGSVIACDPQPGSEFASQDRITLTVAQPLTVPNVVGKSVDDATAVLSEAGLSSTVEYVDSDKTQGIVVATVPAGGTVIEEGCSVVLQVPSPDPTDRYHLLEYYDMTPQQVADYVGRLGFALDGGWSSDAGAFAHYTHPDTREVLYFTHDPETGHFSGTEGSSDVLAQGVSFVGVRYEFPRGTYNQISADGVRTVMNTCGFENLVDYCTEETIVVPADVPASQANFICAYGEQGRYVWAVLIGGYGATNDTVVLVMPKAQFEQADLSNFGGGICDYIAYANYFTG